jgi:hypothetical protein
MINYQAAPPLCASARRGVARSDQTPEKLLLCWTSRTALELEAELMAFAGLYFGISPDLGECAADFIRRVLDAAARAQWAACLT